VELTNILTEESGEYVRGMQTTVLPFTWSEEWMVPPVRIPGDPDVCEFFFPLLNGTNNVVGCKLSSASRNAGVHFFVPVNRVWAVRVRVCAIHAAVLRRLCTPDIGVALCNVSIDGQAEPCGRPWDDIYHGPEELCAACRVKTPGHDPDRHHDFS